MSVRSFTVLLIGLAAVGCTRIEGGFKYEWDGRLLRADGKTPAKGVSVQVVRPKDPNAPEVQPELTKIAAKYNDKSPKRKTDSSGRYAGVLQTFRGWHYTDVMGSSVGKTKAPEPPVLDEVIVYVDEKGVPPVGYRMKLTPEMQAQARSGLRKVHVPDLYLPDHPATQATTRVTTQPTGGEAGSQKPETRNPNQTPNGE